MLRAVSSPEGLRQGSDVAGLCIRELTQAVVWASVWGVEGAGHSVLYGA